MSYALGIDLGGTRCAAAVRLPGRSERPRIVPLATDSSFLASVAFARPDGTLVIGAEAERLAPTDPARVVRQFTRRVGDGTPLLVGGAAVPAETLTAQLVSSVAELVAQRERGITTRIAVTHPTGWGAHRVNSLRGALSARGLAGATLLPASLAAAIAHDSRQRIAPGGAVVVYDLGGSGFEATVLRKLGDDRFTVVGRPERVEVGGLDFDEVIIDHVRASLGNAWDELDPADPAVLASVARLRKACAAAKETLSADTDVLIPIALPGIDHQVRLARAEFEELVRPSVDETVAALLRALDSAEVAPAELTAVLLAGGSARIPLVTQAVSEQLGRPVPVHDDPKGTVAIGAALAVRVPEPEPARTTGLPVPDDPVLRALPSLSVAPPPVPERAGLWRRIPRTVVIGAAATVLAGVAAAGGVAWLADRTGPVGADANPVKRTVVPTTESSAPAPTERETAYPAATTKAQPPRARTTTAPPPRTRTTTPTPSTRTTTAPPSSSTRSTTTRPSTSAPAGAR